MEVEGGSGENSVILNWAPSYSKDGQRGYEISLDMEETVLILVESSYQAVLVDGATGQKENYYFNH